jgi:hypothetical protein
MVGSKLSSFFWHGRLACESGSRRCAVVVNWEGDGDDDGDDEVEGEAGEVTGEGANDASADVATEGMAQGAPSVIGTVETSDPVDVTNPAVDPGEAQTRTLNDVEAEHVSESNTTLGSASAAPITTPADAAAAAAAPVAPVEDVHMEDVSSAAVVVSHNKTEAGSDNTPAAASDGVQMPVTEAGSGGTEFGSAAAMEAPPAVKSEDVQIDGQQCGASQANVAVVSVGEAQAAEAPLSAVHDEAGSGAGAGAQITGETKDDSNI